MKKLLYILICLLAVSPVAAQTTSAPVKTELPDTVKIDTVIIQVGKSSIHFIIRDKKDLEKLQSYDLNKIVDELQLKLDPDAEQQVVLETKTLPELGSDSSSEMEVKHVSHKPRGVRTYFNIDLGMNNYLSPDGFPDETNEPYTVRPWGSWYIALGLTNEVYLARAFSLQFGANISWYNFKFQNDAVYVVREDDMVTFPENPNMLDANFEKSKLTVAYVNGSIVPMIGKRRGFRFGVGAYAGYRIGSYNKVKYDDGDTHKRKDHDSFYLENFRYGVRMQVGFPDFEIFANYDLNNLFTEGRGPELNAISFGITF